MDTNDLKDSTSCWDVTLILLYPPQLLSNIATVIHMYLPDSIIRFIHLWDVVFELKLIKVTLLR